MAKKRMTARGRVWVALILLGFVLVATSVIQRRVLGIRQARDISELERELEGIVSRKLTVEGAIDEARSLARIGPIAEDKLGMRVPPESLSFLIRVNK